MAPIGVKVIRGVFGAAEHLAPRLAGRAAFELFCRTPSRRTLSDGEKRAIARAADFMAEARHHKLRTASGWVVAHEFRSAPGRSNGGTVLVIHGWRSRTEYMKALIAAYREDGYRVISLDLPGHGASPGRRLNMAMAVEAAAVAGQWFGPFAAVVGHSFGGAIAANAAAGSVRGVPALATQRLVLIAAPSSMPKIFEDFARMVKLGPRSHAALGREVERIAGRPLSEFTGARQLADVPVPTLVIHAPDDREVPSEQAELYASAGRHVRLRWAPGLGHRRIIADRGVVADALDFVAGATVASAPSY